MQPYIYTMDEIPLFFWHKHHGTQTEGHYLWTGCPDDFDEQTITDLFGLAGAKMLILDAIIGNGDRHAGNFGWLRDTSTGAYVSMAPLYDFDHALDSSLETDRLLTDAVKFCMPYADEVKHIANIAVESENPVFSKRAQTIINILSK